MIFATTPTDSTVLSYPWWITNALVPAGIAVLGSLLTLYGSLWVAKKTDFYRRLSQWEPYGEQLRSRQIALYEEICTAARNLMATTGTYSWSRSGNPENDRLLRSAMVKATEDFNVLLIPASILLSNRFRLACDRLPSQLDKYLIESLDVHSAVNHPSAHDLWDEISKAYVDLLDAARESIGTDPLEEKAQDAILHSLAPKSENGKN